MAKGTPQRYGLGIDLGGTKILAGVIDLDTGAVVATGKKRTRARHGPAELLDRLESETIDPRSEPAVAAERPAAAVRDHLGQVLRLDQRMWG